MPYKISGTTNRSIKMAALSDSDWSVLASGTFSPGSYELIVPGSAKHVVVATALEDGESLAFGDVDSYFSAVAGGQTGVFSGGDTSGGQTNVMDYVTINSAGNAQDFGDLVIMHIDHEGTSNGGLNRGIIAGGRTTGLSNTNAIEYMALDSAGDASDFGDLTSARPYLGVTSNYSNGRGVFMGGGSSQTNIIDYITISSTGNAQDFGDLLTADYRTTACSNGANNRGLTGGGNQKGNGIEYITISTLGNSADFGDLTSNRYNLAAVDNAVNNRGVFGVGYLSSRVNVMDYVTISTPGNATDFGDVVSISRYYVGSCSNGTSNRGLWAGADYKANIIDYITITSPSNTSDFGDMTVSRDRLAGCSNGE